ncbi:major facilitator superfamily transporter [Hortaea werneckii]|nr:major facilitator superfamily transporter [Hortaea werneckii]
MDITASSSAPGSGEIEVVKAKGDDKRTNHVSTTRIPDEMIPGPSDIEAGDTKRYYSKTSVWLMVLYSGLAIGSDGFNTAIIGNVQILLGELYPNALTDGIYSRLSNAFLVGMIVGMLFFGGIVDQFGRKTGAVATTLLLVLGIVLSTAASGTTPTGMFWMLIVARGIAGVGAGGEYPVSAAGGIEATDENAGMRKYRGFMFAMLADLSASLGYVWGGLTPLLLLLITGQQERHYDIVWRTSFAVGMIPPLSIFWFRMKMAVSTAYRKSAMRCSATWFMYNYVSVPFGIFSGTITTRTNPEGSLIKNLGWGVVINCFYIPGPFIGGFLSDRIGRRQTMCLGFTLQAILGFILGGANEKIQEIFPLFVVLYGIFLTLGEVGPGSTVVLLSSECFPTSIRGQMMGFIAACSKAGAAIGSEVFAAISARFANDTARSNQALFCIGSGFALLGALIAWFIIPDMGRVLGDEDERWRAYLESKGWTAHWGDADTVDPARIRMDKDPEDSPSASPEPPTQRRRTLNDDTIDEVFGNNAEGKAPDSNMDQLVKKFVRLALACEYNRTSIKRKDINEKVIGGSGGSKLFNSLFAETQVQLRSVFGMEMVELPAKEKHTMRERRAAQSQADKPKTTTSWILISTLPPQYREAEIVQPSAIPTSDQEATYTGICTLLTSIVSLHGGSLPDAKFERYLRRLLLEDNTPVAAQPKTEELMKRIIRDGYVLKISDDIGTGDREIYWVVGPRGKVEIGDDGVRGLVKSVYGEVEEDVEEDLERKINKSLGVAEREAAKRQAAQQQNGEKKKRGRNRAETEQDREEDGSDDSDDDE